MRKWRLGWLTSALLLGLSPAIGMADDQTGGTAQPHDADIEQLKSLLEAQRHELADLRQQVSASAMQDADAARTDAMRRQIREILKESEFRDSMMSSALQAGYDDGFFIKSSDDKFKMKFNGKLQFRWTHYDTQRLNQYLAPGLNRDDRTGFDLTRVRFRVSGTAYDPNLTYWMEFKSDAPHNSDFVFDSGGINYRFADEFQVMVGQFGLSTTRASAHGGQQFVDDPMFDVVYGLGASKGVRFWGRLFERKLDWAVEIVNGTSDDGNTNVGTPITADPSQLDGNPALVARAVWHVLGDNPGEEFRSQSDVDFHTAPALDIGVHYVFNDDQYDTFTTRIPVPRIRIAGLGGGFGLVPTNGLQFHDLGIDTGFKWCGFSLTGEYVIRVVDVRRADFQKGPFSPWYLASGDSSTTAQHGAYVQAGYFLPLTGALEKKVEVVARLGGISALAEDTEGAWEYAGGVNYYIHGDRVKLQMDVTRVYEAPTTSAYSSLANVNDEALIWRMQLALAF